MSANDLNPDSAILQQLDGQWQKIAAVLVWKLARNGVTLTVGDFASFPKDHALYTHGHRDSIDFKLVTMADAERLAAHDRSTNRGRA